MIILRVFFGRNKEPERQQEVVALNVAKRTSSSPRLLMLTDRDGRFLQTPPCLASISEEEKGPNEEEVKK